MDSSHLEPSLLPVGFSLGSVRKQSDCNVGDLGFIPGLGRSPRGGHGNPLQYSCLEISQGHRSLMGYIPWGHKDSDMTEQLSTAQCFPICISDSFFRFGKVSAKISSNMFSLSSPFGIPIVHKLACFILSNRSLMLLSCCLFFFLICLSICCLHWVIAISLSSRSLILSSVLFILLLIAFSSVLSLQMTFLGLLGFSL